jgi:hypothetical protein
VLNLLVAYPYMKSDMVAALTEGGTDVRLLVDSGAFTAWKAGQPITLDDYCRFLEALPIRPWRYFMLDVIGDPGATMKNYEIMLKRGFAPIPIFTRGEDPSVLDDYYKTSDLVGVGGLVHTERNQGFVKGIMEKIGQRKVHWLGFTNQSFMAAFKPYSCDSSSWQAGFMYGRLAIYLGRGKWITTTRDELPKLARDTQVANTLSRLRVSLRELSEKSAWTTSGRISDVSLRITMPSYIWFMRDVMDRLGTHYFMAVTASCYVRCLSHFLREERV